MDPFKGKEAFNNTLSIKEEYNKKITKVIKIYETKLINELEKL
jgi:hypothetical protein